MLLGAEKDEVYWIIYVTSIQVNTVQLLKEVVIGQHALIQKDRHTVLLSKEAIYK